MTRLHLKWLEWVKLSFETAKVFQWLVTLRDHWPLQLYSIVHRSWREEKEARRERSKFQFSFGILQLPSILILSVARIALHLFVSRDDVTIHPRAVCRQTGGGIARRNSFPCSNYDMFTWNSGVSAARLKGPWFCPKKADHTSGLTIHQGFEPVYLILIGTCQKLTLHPKWPYIRGPYKRDALNNQTLYI